MANERLFQYAVLFHPTEDERKAGKRTEMVTEPEFCLATDQQQAIIRAAREIPERCAEDLDRTEVVCRPFNGAAAFSITGSSGSRVPASGCVTLTSNVVANQGQGSVSYGGTSTGADPEASRSVSGAELRKALAQGRSYAAVPTSSDEFSRRKQEDILLEDRSRGGR